MMRRFIVVLCALAMLCTGALAAAEETTTAPETEMAVETETAPETTAAAETTTGAKWSDFVVTLDGTAYSLPVSVSELTAAGWIFEDESLVFQPSQYSMEQIHNGDEQVMAFVLNAGIDDAVLADCLVVGFQFDIYTAQTGTQLMLADGVTVGSLKDDVLAAYGEASNSYAGDYYNSFTWTQDSYQEVELSFSVENDGLEQITVRYFVVPEGYNDAAYAAEVSVPESVTAYQAPAELGTDLLSFNFQLDGVVYSLPVPAAALAANGWALNGNLYNAKLAAHDIDIGWKLTNNAQSLESVGIYNDSTTANIAENSMVIQLSVRNTGTIDFKLPGDITINTTMEELEAALANVPYEREEDSFINYTVKENDNNFRSITFVFNADDGKMTSIEMNYWPE